MCKNTLPQGDPQDRITLRDGSTRMEKLGTGCLIGSALGIGLGLICAFTRFSDIINWPLWYFGQLGESPNSHENIGVALLVYGIYWILLGQACYWTCFGMRRMRRKDNGRPPSFPPV